MIATAWPMTMPDAPAGLLAAGGVVAPGWLATAFMGVGGLIVLGLLAAQAVRRRWAPAPRPAQAAGRLDPHEVRAAVGELEDLAGKLVAEIDAKAARLERLIAEADARLTALDGALHQGARPHAARQQAGRPGTAGSEGFMDPISSQIYALADEGLPPVEIAQRLDQHTGNVELVLALRGR
jgi:hypothetical protein